MWYKTFPLDTFQYSNYLFKNKPSVSLGINRARVTLEGTLMDYVFLQIRTYLYCVIPPKKHSNDNR